MAFLGLCHTVVFFKEGSWLDFVVIRETYLSVTSLFGLNIRLLFTDLFRIRIGIRIRIRNVYFGNAQRNGKFPYAYAQYKLKINTVLLISYRTRYRNRTTIQTLIVSQLNHQLL